MVNGGKRRVPAEVEWTRLTAAAGRTETVNIGTVVIPSMKYLVPGTASRYRA